MSDEQIKREIKSLGDNINEILSSTEAVKGEPFTRAVATQFECAQLIELLARLTALAAQVDKELADSTSDSMMNILASVACKATHDISEGDMEEAMKMAHQIYQRRTETAKRIVGMLKDDE